MVTRSRREVSEHIGLAARAGLHICALLLLLSGLESTWAAESAALEIESKIPLGDVRGRIDHLAVDLHRQRLYVAELGNNSVGVIDLKDRKAIRTLTGLAEPQGVGYVPSTDTLYVANAGDGSVRLFQGAQLTAAEQIDLGDDADNVRVDDATHRVLVGYGSGALAVIDTDTRAKIADIRLKGHPESFQLDRGIQQKLPLSVSMTAVCSSAPMLAGIRMTCSLTPSGTAYT